MRDLKALIYSPLLASTILATALASVACSHDQPEPHVGPPNSADRNQEAMKEAEAGAEERDEYSKEMATQNLDNVDVIEETELSTDDVDTELNDQ